MKEERLLTNTLEYTNEPYVIAKIAGIKTSESYNLQYGTNFILVMSTNFYGLNDNFNLEIFHILSASVKVQLGRNILRKNNRKAIRKDLKNKPIEGINENSSKKEIVEALSKLWRYPNNSEETITDSLHAIRMTKNEIPIR